MHRRICGFACLLRPLQLIHSMWGTIPLTTDSTYKGHLQTLRRGTQRDNGASCLFYSSRRECEGFTVAPVAPGNCDVNCAKACLSVFLFVSPEAADDESADALLLERLQHLFSCSAEPRSHINTRSVSFCLLHTQTVDRTCCYFGENQLFFCVFTLNLCRPHL